jgi:hypothetical protein
MEFAIVRMAFRGQKKETWFVRETLTRETINAMRYIAILALAACGSSSDTPDAGITDCDILSKLVTQERGTCRITKADDGDCALIQGAYCQPDGVSSSCPSGWGRDCEVGPGGTEINCTYVLPTCPVDSLPYTDFTFVQTLNGIRGLTVASLDGTCKFTPCSAL